MIAEDRAAIVAWQLFGGQASIERFRSELERQTTPAWNRAVAAIAGAIRDAEAEARALATEAVEWRRRDESETSSWPRGPRRRRPWATSPTSVRMCQEPDVNVPLMFTKNAPRMFTKNVPGMFTENAPPMFGQNVPHVFTSMHHPAQSLPLPHPRQALSQGEEPARWRLLRRGECPAMHCC